MVWGMRDEFLEREAVPVDEALRRAEAAAEGLVILSDTGDTVFGGAAGDSNVILEAVLRLGMRSKVLIPMISPTAVERLAAAGEGATVTLPLGGCTAPAFFTPLEVTGTVRRIADGGAVKVDFGHQSVVDMGRVVIFETGPVTMLIIRAAGRGGEPARRLARFRRRADGAPDRRGEDRVELPVFRADHVRRSCAPTRAVPGSRTSTPCPGDACPARSTRSTNWPTGAARIRSTGCRRIEALRARTFLRQKHPSL